jgi:hypothetical protein
MTVGIFVTSGGFRNTVVTKKHLQCVKSERQNIPLAMQLLSHPVATCLIQYQPGYFKELAKQTGRFMEQMST